MVTKELLDDLTIWQSPLTGRVYIGVPHVGNPNEMACKSDFTDRLKEFAPQMFEREEAE